MYGHLLNQAIFTYKRGLFKIDVITARKKVLFPSKITWCFPIISITPLKHHHSLPKHLHSPTQAPPFSIISCKGVTRSPSLVTRGSPVTSVWRWFSSVTVWQLPNLGVCKCVLSTWCFWGALHCVCCFSLHFSFWFIPSLSLGNLVVRLVATVASGMFVHDICIQIACENTQLYHALQQKTQVTESIAPCGVHSNSSTNLENNWEITSSLGFLVSLEPVGLWERFWGQKDLLYKHEDLSSSCYYPL